MTVISTNTTAGVPMNVNGDFLTVLSSGSIVAPASSISGSENTGQSISIAGYVEVSSISLGGGNTISIAASGVFNGRGVGTEIFLGRGTGTDTGGSRITNAGLIQSAGQAIELFGNGNSVTNSGTISSRSTAVFMGYGTQDSFVNTGTITSTTAYAVLAGGDFASVFNSGVMTSAANSAVLLGGLATTLHNSGSISSGGETGSAVSASNGNVSVYNDGFLVSSQFAAVSLDSLNGAVENSGHIRGYTSGLVFGGSYVIVENAGEIVGQTQDAIFLTTENENAFARIQNTGTITGAVTAIEGSVGVDQVINSGVIHGRVLLGAGADIYDGRGGEVTGKVFGGNGSDTFYIDNATVSIVELVNDTGTDTVFSAVTYQLAANIEALTLLESGRIDGYGNATANTLTGNSSANLLGGQGGQDTIYGGLGDDSVNGNGGADVLLGDDGDDVLRGGDGNDVLIGGEGDDRLAGGNGTDKLTGGDGEDVFVFTTAAQSPAAQSTADRITDFTRGDDHIDLSGIDARSTGTTADDAFVFIGTAAFGNIAGQLRFQIDAPNNATFVQMDVNGDGLADSIIRLNGQLQLTAGDFVL